MKSPKENNTEVTLKQLEKLAALAETLKAPIRIINGKPHYVLEPLKK